MREDVDNDFSVDSIDPAPREDGQPGPPDDWPYLSWFDLQDRDWWWRGPRGWQRDPCPAKALGMREGEYVFITAFGEIRHFTAGQLHGRGGLADLFVGSLWWPMRHFRKYDIEKRELKGGLQEKRCIRSLMRCCRLAGFYDGRTPHRSVGTWRGPNGVPIVHAGDRIFDAGDILEPGQEIGEALFVVGGKREAPSYINTGRDTYEWAPADPGIGRAVSGELDEWVWDSAEARDLYQGGLFCDMLCSALLWLPHKFVRAPYGSGKSSLLRYSRALLGGSAHAVLKTYSKAFIEQHYAGTACAFYLDEMESDEAGDRMRRIRELVRQLSDDGAEGGRGTTSGRARKLDVHGTVTMAATLTEDWPPQDRSRITLLELRPFRDRLDRPPAPPELIAALVQRAAERSAALRARAISRFELFVANLKVARAGILKLGGSPRDADQLGHLIAGWWTMVSDEPFEVDDLDQFARFQPFVMSLSDEEHGEDAASDLLNVIFGLVPDLWRSGERQTVGQLVALARSNESEASTARRSLLTIGLKFYKQADESWGEAWLMVATRHAGLDRLLASYPDFQGPKRFQILRQLKRGPWEAKPSESHTRFAGVQSRYTLVPPVFLPTWGEEVQ